MIWEATLIKKILVTGGIGFIGSHTCVELIKNNFEVVIIDNCSNSRLDCIDRLQSITNTKISFYNGDICDEKLLFKIFSENDIYAVIHFAALKSVGESNKIPLKYYDNNVGGSIKLLNCMEKFGVKNLIYSSSATVYGNNVAPYNENMKIGNVTNPYGRTKLIVEEMLQDLSISDASWKIISLRYFNPIGAHESGLIGENPVGMPNNIMPIISQVACNKLSELVVFGNDYDTPDGTCIRDYIHVVDLAKGHISALNHLDYINGFECYNLGTGKGYSVMELIRTFEQVNNVKVKFKVGNRRVGDVPICYADVAKAYKELSWRTIYDLEKMCYDTWNWQKILISLY